MKPKSAIILPLWAHQVLKDFQHPTAVLTGRQLSTRSAGIVSAPSPASPSTEPIRAALSVPAHMYHQHPPAQVNSAENLQAKLGIHPASLPSLAVALGKQGSFYLFCMDQKINGSLTTGTRQLQYLHN